MKSKKLLVSILSLTLSLPYFTSVSAETNQPTPQNIALQSNSTKVTEEVQTENGLANFTKETQADGTVVAELVEKDATTKIVFNPNTNELFVNGEKQKLKVSKTTEKPAESGDFSIMAIPSGGTYVGAFKYSLSIATLTASAAAAALSAVTKAPYSACLAALSVFIGATSVVYYTVYQYRYPMKCEAIPYFNQTKVWTSSSRTTVHKVLESGKFFSTKPVPLSCTP